MLTPRRAIVLAVGLCAALTACGGQSQTASTSDRVLTVGVTQYGASLDPTVPTGPIALIQSLTNASITYGAPDGTIGPDLATSWRYLNGGTEDFEFTLRPNARFSDGTPVTADAVKTWLEFFARSKSVFVPRIPIASIEVRGKWTVVLHLERPTPDLPRRLSQLNGSWGFVCSPKAVANPKSLAKDPVGAGPYVIVPSETVTGNKYTFVPNTHYWDRSAIKWEKIVIKVITKPSTMLAAIKSGELDVANGDPTTVAAARAAGLEVVSAPTGWNGLFLLDKGPKTPDGSRPNPLASLKVRQALNYAVDRATVTEAILGENGSPTSIGPATDAYDPEYKDYYPYDPEKAKALLAEAGYPDGFTLDTLSQSWWGTTGDQFLQAMAKYLSAVGVKLNIRTGLSNADWIAAYRTGKYPATGFVQTPLNTMNDWYEYFIGPNAVLNVGRSDDPELTRLRNAAVASPTEAEANEHWLAMARRVVTQALHVPVLEQSSFWYAAKGVDGVAFSASTGYAFPRDWYPAK